MGSSPIQKFVRLILAAGAVIALTAGHADAQFGRNKVQYDKFKFQVLSTQHFDIYYYDREQDVVNDVGRQAERWYTRLSRTFNHTFNRKPIVLYANAADFQQTTTTSELIGEGTGGFTESARRRVVLPISDARRFGSRARPRARACVSATSSAATPRLPLWFIEGDGGYCRSGGRLPDRDVAARFGDAGSAAEATDLDSHTSRIARTRPGPTSAASLATTRSARSCEASRRGRAQSRDQRRRGRHRAGIRRKRDAISAEWRTRFSTRTASRHLRDKKLTRAQIRDIAESATARSSASRPATAG
jgi:hypothetical protein